MHVLCARWRQFYLSLLLLVRYFMVKLWSFWADKNLWRPHTTKITAKWDGMYHMPKIKIIIENLFHLTCNPKSHFSVQIVWKFRGMKNHKILEYYLYFLVTSVRAKKKTTVLASLGVQIIITEMSRKINNKIVLNATYPLIFLLCT